MSARRQPAWFLPAWFLPVVLVLASPLWAEEAPGTLSLKGAPAHVVPPPSTWTRTVRTPGAGQWYVHYAGPAKTWVEARVFPVQGDAKADVVLMQAVDTYRRGLGAGGFGMPTRKPIDILGCEGADGTIQLVVGQQVFEGHARLLRLPRARWAFALGGALRGGDKAHADAVKAFVTSLLPTEPVFYAPTFEAADLDRAVVRPADEPAVTLAQVVAVEALVEAGMGARLPVSERPRLRSILIEEARDGSPKTREGFRQSAEAVRAMGELPPAKRAETMRALGARVLEQVQARAKDGGRAAAKLVLLWRDARKTVAGTVEDGLPLQSLGSLLEMDLFLASVAADREIPLSAARRDALQRSVAEAWPTLTKAERDALRGAGAQWAALRHAWDQARAPARFAFRRGVLARLLPGAKEAVEALGDGAALKRWMAAQVGSDRQPELVTAAFALTAADRQALLDLLGTHAAGYRFGW